MDDRSSPDLKEEALPRDKVSPRRRRGFWIVFGLVFIGGMIWWIRQGPGPQPTGRAAGNLGGPTPVVAATIQKGDVDIAFTALGTVTPLATVTVVSQISGQLTRVAFREGQMVKQGDLLAEIDWRPYELTLQTAQGQLTKDQALLENARLDLTRYESLSTQNAVPKQTLDTQKSLVQQYQGAVITDQAAIDTAKLNIAYCHIVAPVTGRIGLRLVDQGNYINASSATGLVVITQLQPISVIFTMPEDNLPPVLKQLQANVTLAVTVFDRAGRQPLANGTLATLDNQIDTSTGTVKLRAQFANADLNLFPNQFVNVRLLVDTVHDATVAPGAAIQRGAGTPSTFVYLINQDNTVTVRRVELGPGDSERISVTSGLSPGDKVVVDGADKLRDGAKIALRTEAGDAASSTPVSAPGGRQRNRSPGGP